MTAELTEHEAEILIAVLTFAEGAALEMNPSIVEALKVLRPWRIVSGIRSVLWNYGQPLEGK